MLTNMSAFFCGNSSAGGTPNGSGSTSLGLTPYPNCSIKLRRGAAALDFSAPRASFASARAAAASCQVSPTATGCPEASIRGGPCDWTRVFRRWRPVSLLAVLQRLAELPRLGIRFISKRNDSMSSSDLALRFTMWASRNIRTVAFCRLTASSCDSFRVRDSERTSGCPSDGALPGRPDWGLPPGFRDELRLWETEERSSGLAPRTPSGCVLSRCRLACRLCGRWSCCCCCCCFCCRRRCNSSWSLSSLDGASPRPAPANMFAASRKQIWCVTTDDGGLGKLFRIKVDTGENGS